MSFPGVRHVAHHIFNIQSFFHYLIVQIVDISHTNMTRLLNTTVANVDCCLGVELTQDTIPQLYGRIASHISQLYL